MSDKVESDNEKEKIQKLMKILKNLEEKYNKFKKDRTSLLVFTKKIIPCSPDLAAHLECPGEIDTEDLMKAYNSINLRDSMLKEEVESLKEIIKKLTKENDILSSTNTSMKFKIEKDAERIRKLEVEMKSKLNVQGNAILNKIKNFEASDKSSSFGNKAALEVLEERNKIQAEVISSLKSQLNACQNSLKELPKELSIEKLENHTQTEEQDDIEKKAYKQSISELKNSLDTLQNEYKESKKKAQAILNEKEAEISKLKVSIRSSKGNSKTLIRGERTSDPDIIKESLLDRTGKFASEASFEANDRIVIAQLRMHIKELMDIIGMQTNREKELSKKVNYYESNRKKEDVNYEYIKNVFLKYLAYKDNNEEESNRMKEILLDLLSVTKKEREQLTKYKAGGFWKSLYDDVRTVNFKMLSPFSMAQFTEAHA